MAKFDITFQGQGVNNGVVTVITVEAPSKNTAVFAITEDQWPEYSFIITDVVEHVETDFGAVV